MLFNKFFPDCRYMS